ncbi:MAG TPA: FAD-dependent oxidoreductase [Pontiella sp.]
MSENKKKVVVVGNGMVGFRFCEKLIEYDAFHEYEITVLGEEPIPAYDRISLSKIFSGKKEHELILAEARWYEYYKISLCLGVRVTAIDRGNKTVTATSGETLSYDFLVIATGARPRIPDSNGADFRGVHVYRTTNDVAAIRARARNADNAVILGGGLLGLEAAEACREMGLHTTIIERDPVLMTRQLDETAGRILHDKVEDLGIHTRTDAHVEQIEGSDAVESVTLTSGEKLPAELVILAAGIEPNDELAREAGLLIGPRGGISVNNKVQTSDPSIYAIGECAAFEGTTFGLVAPGYAMAEVAAANLGHINKSFELEAPASKLKLLDLQVASLGQTHLMPPQAIHFIAQRLDRGVYKKLLFDPESRKLLGAILIGETSEFERLRKHLQKENPVPIAPAEWLAPIGEPYQAELDLEDNDVVCFCSYVTKGDICKAINEQNLQSTQAVMGATYAASLCGSCFEMVDAVTKEHLRNNS